MIWSSTDVTREDICMIVDDLTGQVIVVDGGNSVNEVQWD